MEVTTRFELVNEGFADLCLTTWPRHHISENWYLPISTVFWSGRRGSNSLPPPWQGGALPDELRPQDVYSLRRIHKKWCLRSESNQWHGDFQSPALPTELQRRTGRWLLYLKFRFCKGVNANFFEKIEKFLLFGVSACKIRTTFFRGFRAGGSTGKERKNIWQVLQPMV